MSENKISNGKSDMMRQILTLFLGTLVVLWRVVLPTNLEITAGIVILVAVLDLILTASVIFINRKELKEAFMRPFTKKDFLVIIVCFILHTLFTSLIALIQFTPFTFEQSAGDIVAVEFHRTFPLGVFISMALAAPVFEEIVFRMAGRNLIKNTFLYLVITTWLFAFIHTASFISPGNIMYILPGLGFALIYLKTKDVRIVIAVHMLGNIIGRVLAFINQ